MKLSLRLPLLALPLLAQACGGITATDRSGGAIDGDAAAGSSSANATGGSGGSGGEVPGHSGGLVGGGGTPPCPACQDYKVGSLIDMPACCSGPGQCGALVGLSGKLFGLPDGCNDIGQHGALDQACVPLQMKVPDFLPSSFPGCCREQGVCGNLVDLSSIDGPNFGCVDTSGVTGVSPAPCGSGGP